MYSSVIMFENITYGFSYHDSGCPYQWWIVRGSIPVRGSAVDNNLRGSKTLVQRQYVVIPRSQTRSMQVRKKKCFYHARYPSGFCTKVEEPSLNPCSKSASA